MKVLYVDPQSGLNLAQYDYNLLSNITADITYCCSIIYDAPIIKNTSYKYVFQYNGIKNKVRKALSYICSIIRIIYIAKKSRPDVIHIQWWKFWVIDYCALLFFKRYCKYTVYTAHNVLPHDSGNSFFFRCKKYYQRVDRIIVHVESSKNELINKFNISSKKIFVIPHGVLSSSANPDAVHKQYIQLVKRWGVNDKIVFSSIGYQSHYKGTDLLKKAYQNSPLLQKNPDVLFIVAGKGNIFAREMMNNYENLLIIDDFISSEMLEAVMNSTDVLLLPYREISQSGVLLSAIDKKIPYIASDVGGLSEPLTIANIGWLLPSNSSLELQSLLESLISNPNDIIRKKDNLEGWRSIKSYYDWALIAIKTMECYKKTDL